MRFRNRDQAGRRLAEAVVEALDPDDARDGVVLALPRGGVPVAAPVAEALGVPLDVLVVRKLGMPGHEELAMGAIASGGALVFNDDVARAVDESDRAEVLQRERAELDRREQLLRGDRPAPRVAGRTVVLVDDGLATGATMRAAVAALRALGAARVVVAVPVGARGACELVAEEADLLVCLDSPRPFRAVGGSYVDFEPPQEAQLRELLGATG